MIKKSKFSPMVLLPFINISVIILVTAILTGGKNLSLTNLYTILEQSLTIILAGAGVIFVMSTGSTDLSIGSLACMAAVLATKIAMPYGLLPMFGVAIAVGLLSALGFGIAAAKFHVPSFMGGMALKNAYAGFIAYYLGSGQILATEEVMVLNRMGVKVPLIFAMVAILWYVYEYTRFGKYLKAMGENEQYAKVSGINTVKMRTCAYLVTGLMAGIAGIFFLVRVGGTSVRLGGGVEMRCVLGFVLGGAAVGGGFQAKMYKMILGVTSVLILENGMTIAGITGGAYQIAEAVLLVVIILVNRYLTNKAILKSELESKRLKAEADALAAQSNG